MAKRAPAKATEAEAVVDDGKHQWIAVCRGTGCVSSESAQIHQALIDELAAHGLDGKVEVRRTGCFGFCSQGPIVVIHPEETFYTHVKPSDVKEIVATHIVGGQRIDRLLYFDPTQNIQIEKWSEIGFYGKQKRVLLAQLRDRRS